MERQEMHLRERICELGLSLFGRGLTAGSSGNLSARLDDGWLATPTGYGLGNLDPVMIARLDMNGRLLAGSAPTKEAKLHSAIYSARRSAEAVVHLHSHWSVALSMLADVEPSNVLPPLTAYQVMKVGRVPLIPYFPPGAVQLADAVRGFAKEHSILLLARHGPLAAGVSLSATTDSIEEMEATARLYLTLKGLPINPLTREQIDEICTTFGVTW